MATLELGRAGYSRVLALEAPAGAQVPLVQEVFEHDLLSDSLLERVRALPRPYQQILEVTQAGKQVSVTLERFIGVQGAQVISRLREVERLLPLNAWGELARTWLAAVPAQDEVGVSTPESLGVDLQGRLVLTANLFNFSVGSLPPRNHPQIVSFPSTLSPEHVRGDPVTGASRVYSVAASLVRLLTGEALFVETGGALLRRILTAGPSWSPTRHPEVEERLAAVLTRALALRPEARFATIDEFAQALTAVLPPPASFVDAVVGLCAPVFHQSLEALTDPRVLPPSWRAGGLGVLEDRLLEHALPLAAFPVPSRAPAG